MRLPNDNGLVSGPPLSKSARSASEQDPQHDAEPLTREPNFGMVTISEISAGGRVQRLWAASRAFY